MSGYGVKKCVTCDKNSSPPVVMTIAGSDSGGGAGIQADIKTITCLGAFGTSVIAALTAQNGAEVRGVFGIPADFISCQLATVRDGFPIKAAKTGMLATGEIIQTVCDGLKNREFPLVVDPVCVSQSGYKLLQDEALDALRGRLIAKAYLLTPNLPEAELLSGISINSEKNVEDAIKALLDLGAGAVLIKGGHFESQASSVHMTDWLGLPGQRPIPLSHPRVDTGNNHGTGCTLSAAIATFLALGCELEEAVIKAQAFLNRALRESFNPGIGAGPPNFLAGAGHKRPF